MEIFNQFGIDIGYVILGMTGVIVIMLIMIIINLVKLHNMRETYKEFMSGEDVKSMENAILNRFADIDELQDEVEEIHDVIEEMDERLVNTYQKIGMVKYDAFKEIGGKLSFVLCLLTDENNGFIINSMHSTKEGCYTYSKEIVNGEAFVILSEEEQQALEEAKQNKGLENVNF